MKSQLEMKWHRWFAALLLGLMTASLPAAITDADLAKVTQLIQEGKTARAKAEITILLDDNPNDSNAPKLKKILTSLDNPNTTEKSQTTSSSNGPSEKETLEWIQAHIAQLQVGSDYSSSGYRMSVQNEILKVGFKNGGLIIVSEQSRRDSFQDTPKENILIVSKCALAVSDILGEVEVTRSESGIHTPALLTMLLFTAKPGKVIKLSSSITQKWGNDRAARWFLDDKEVDSSSVEDRRSVLSQRIEAGKGKQSTKSQFEISVAPKYAERFKAAFDHLIKLHGGGKAEAF